MKRMGGSSIFIAVLMLVIIITVVAATAFANFIVYIIHWEQNQTDWCEVSTYGQEHSVYITIECSFREPSTFHVPAEFAGVLAAQITQAGIDANINQDPSPLAVE